MFNLNDFDRFLIDIDDCKFIHSSEQINVNITSNAATALDYHKPSYRTSIWIRIDKLINDKAYSFLSPELAFDVDNLKLKLELFKASFVYYNRHDPASYFFEL